MSLDHEAQLLVDYGLTHSQAIVYLAAVELGTALVSKISKISGVRREDVYRMMVHLEEIGLVEKMPTKPTKIRAVPLEQAVSLLIERQKNAADRKISELTARKDDVVKRIKSQIVKIGFEEEPEAEFALLSSKKDVLNKLTGMIQGAQKEIDVVTAASEFLSSLSLFREHIEKSARKGVKVHAIFELEPSKRSITHRIEEHALPEGFLDFRYTRASLGHYLMVDFEQAILATSPEPPIGERPYLWTCNEKFVATLCGNFEEAWHSCASSGQTSNPRSAKASAE